MHCRFALRYREVEELLAARGVVRTDETVRQRKEPDSVRRRLPDSVRKAVVRVTRPVGNGWTISEGRSVTSGPVPPRG